MDARPHPYDLRIMRILLCLAIVWSLAPFAEADAQDPCANLADQIAAQDQALDNLKNDALPWLKQASVSAATVPGELASVAAQGDVPILTPDLASTDGALAAQVGAEMDVFSSDADALDSASLATDLSSRLLDWQGRLAVLQSVAAYSAGLASMFSAMQYLGQNSSEAQAALSLRESLSQSLATCQAANANLPALGCGLTYFGLDRSTSPAVLKPAVPALPSGAQPGDQWSDSVSYDAGQGSTVDRVDTFTCIGDGATKVGATAVQSYPDGSTVQWGESNYTGTLWPKTIPPGASWEWQASQYYGTPDAGDAETWNVTVDDAGRESLQLPQGNFEAIRLHMEEDIVQPDGETQHVAWDEWYARPVP